MTYAEALHYLETFIDYEKQDVYDYRASLDLGRMRRFAHLLGDPQKNIKSIHIAGSKGKGSTAAIVYSILKAAGLKTGLYTSPHLVSFRERIRINDTLISENDIARLLNKLKDTIDRLKKDDIPSFFEIYTALCYMYFNENKIDMAVYEVGLGGRLDATNVIEPLVSGITPISYEHTQKLGNTLSQIAAEKGGIIKEKTVCVSAPQEEEALKSIKEICAQKEAKLVLVGRDITFEEISSDEEREVFNVYSPRDEYRRLEAGLLGSHQIVNAATAIGIIEELGSNNIYISHDAIMEGVASARWAGRLDIAARKPHIVLDGAQNRASAAALAKSIKKIFKFRNLILVLGVSKDKDISGILEELLPISDSIILTKAKMSARAREPLSIKEAIKGRDAVITSSVGDAIRRARSEADEEDLILVTGSLFVVGEAMEILGHSSIDEGHR